MSVGIVSYGAYLPTRAIGSDQIAKAQGKANLGPALGVEQKTIPSIDEDTATMSVEAASQALARINNFDKEQINGLWIGSESHPYAVKPTGTMVASALGLSRHLSMADLQFACKAGTQALQIGLAYAAAGWGQYQLAIGADTAQSRTGDVLEFTAAAGASAFVVGSDQLLARLVDTTSVASDTPDFWRRPGEGHPQHAGRFSGEPAYFAHISASVESIMQKAGLKIDQFQHCVFHTPNGKFPTQIASRLGCSANQMKHSLIVKSIGNTYAGASLLALANVLDHAQKDDLILVASYGSGAGSDAFVFQVTDRLARERRGWNNLLEQQISRLERVKS